MDTLKSLFVILFFTINSLCYAIEIECSICHERFDRGKASGTVCPECKALIAAVKEWKKGCPECRKYVWLDLCLDCLERITKQEGTCNDRHHKLYNVCTECLKAACKAAYDAQESPNCLMSGCTDPISSKGCCGYPTGLCTNHNESLMKAIITHKSKCKTNCKQYPFLDICPECLELINDQKAGHSNCIWKDTPYDVYVPCATCLACYACE